MFTTPHLSRNPIRATSYRRGLTRGQLQAVVVGIVMFHVAAVWGLLQVKAVREVVVQAAPMFFEMVREPAPVPVTPRPPEPQAIAKITSVPLIVTPTPAEPSFAVEGAAPEEVAEPEAVLQAPPAPPAVPPPPPKMIPASKIAYLVWPQIDDRTRRTLHESGRVTMRVYVDEAGMPGAVQVTQSSGFPRLDEAAIKAVQKARFKPYIENGQATAGWALSNLNFKPE